MEAITARRSARRFGPALAACTVAAILAAGAAAQEEGVQRALRLEPGKGNPRNSEGAFVRLKDGRVMFAYTHFTGGSGDHAQAHLAARFSADEGGTWTEKDAAVVPYEGGLNVMSVSLLRLKGGEIALFYLRKTSRTDCRPQLRLSRDEGKTWSEPRTCIPDAEIGYYVLNNDRAVQLKSGRMAGRIVLPVAQHHGPGQSKYDSRATMLCYLSDDGGKTWRRSRDARRAKSPEGKEVMLQEPGVVELKDGRLMMFCRTDAGSQYVSFSADGGDGWEELKPSTLISPLSPASIKRIPKTGDLVAVWNDHANIDQKLKGKRTPLVAAVSKDDGKTWGKPKTIEGDPDGWYCYTAIEFVGDWVLLGHCAGDRRKGNGLATTQITRMKVDWVYR